MSGRYIDMNAELADKLTKDMGGISEGIILQEAVPGVKVRPYRVRVFDRKAKKYLTRAFNTTHPLVTWARETWTSLEKGTISAGSVTLQAEMPGFLQSLRDRIRCEPHIKEIERILTAAHAFGVNDLKSDSVAKKASQFLAQYRPKVGFGTRTKPQAPATMLRYITHFRAFGKYLCQQTLDCPRPKLLINPFLALQRPEVDDTLMNIFTIDESEALASDLALSRNDGVFFALRLYTGMRKREAAWLRWEHINWDGKLISVKLPDEMDDAEATRMGLTRYTGKRVKGQKERLVILANELAELLMKIRPYVGRGYVFRDSIRSRASHVECKSFRYHLEKLGIKRPEMTPHDLRSTNACLWLHAGLDSLRLVNHLGHADADITNHYAGRANEYRAHPRAQGWAGEICLRRHQQFNVGSTRALPSAPTGSSEIAPEDDIDDCIIALIPDKLDLCALE